MAAEGNLDHASVLSKVVVNRFNPFSILKRAIPRLLYRIHKL